MAVKVCVPKSCIPKSSLPRACDNPKSAVGVQVKHPNMLAEDIPQSMKPGGKAGVEIKVPSTCTDKK